MKAVVQRVAHACVTVDGEIKGKIENGFLVLLGVMDGDSEKEAELMAKKIKEIRIFTDDEDKMNLALEQVDGGVLAVSQFTLCADISKGRRPSFTPSAGAQEAERLYEHFCSELVKLGVKKVEKGVFGADMKVELLNDGPVTIIMDTDMWKRSK